MSDAFYYWSLPNEALYRMAEEMDFYRQGSDPY